MSFSFARFTRRGPAVIAEDRLKFLDLPLEEYGLIALYVMFAAVWSGISSTFLDWVGEDPLDSPGLQALNGLNFILISGVLLFVVLRRSYRVRRRAQAASRLNQARFESVARATTDAIWDWDLDTNAVWWSDGFQTLFRYHPGDLTPSIDWWLNRLHPEDKERVTEGIRQVIDSGGERWSSEYRLRRQDGTYAQVLDRVHVLRDGEGQPVRLVGGISDVTEQRRAEEALERSRRQLRALSARLQAAREGERTRIAREIHDELGQVLTALKINLDWLEDQLSERIQPPAPSALIERVVETGSMADSALGSVRRIAADLRPLALDTLGLAAAVRQETERFSRQTGQQVEVDLPSDLGEVPEAVSTAIYRILQEALTNIARHAGSKRVQVRLSADAHEIRLEVVDDGCGIPVHAGHDPRALGLLGMRERALILGGELSLGPIAPRGTRVALRLPRRADEDRFWAELHGEMDEPWRIPGTGEGVPR